MDSYTTEEEQIEAIRRWWDENGRSTLLAIVVALAAGFGWQYWKDYDHQRAERASHVYQSMLESLGSATTGAASDFTEAKSLAEQLKNEYAGTSYAQFAALHLAKLAAQDNDSVEAQAQLRWVLSKAPGQSDVADVAQLRLARILASSGDTQQALDILAKGDSGTYAASYAIAKGDIYMQLEQHDDARVAYAQAKNALARNAIDGRITTLEHKLQSLNPTPARHAEVGSKADSVDDTKSPETQNQED